MITTEQAIRLLEGPVYKWSLDWDDREDGLDYCDAIQAGIEALKEKLWSETLWHDAKTDPPKAPGQYYGKKDDSNNMWLCEYRDGKWRLACSAVWSAKDLNQEMGIVRWAEYGAFAREEDC